MKVGALLLVVVAVIPSEAQASEAASPKRLFSGPFSFYVENDSLAPDGGDESFTQGLELHATLREEGLPQPLQLLRKITRAPFGGLRGGRQNDEGSSFVLGNTIFTPQNIITYEPRRDDRPFVGHLYSGVSSVLVDDTWSEDEGKRFRPRRITSRLVLGVTGRYMGAAHWAQASFHVLRESRIPKGWYSEAANRPEVNAIFIREDIVSPERIHSNVDLTLVGQAALGTTQTFASAGAVLRVGHGLTGFPPLNIAQSAAPGSAPKLEVAGLAGIEAKGLAWSRLTDQGGAGRPELRHFVWEWRVGGLVRWPNGLSASYVVRRRSQEIEPLPPGLLAKHWIASLQIAKSPGATPVCSCFDFLKGARANFSLGWGRSTTVERLPLDPATSVAGHWGLEKSLSGNRFAAGVETTGVAREHGRGDGTSHEDTFLLAKVLSLGVDVLPNLKGPHRLQLRVGGGKATVKTQRTPVEGTIDEPDTLEDVADHGKSLLVGVRYTLRLGRPLSLAVNGDYSWLFLDGLETRVRRAGYWTTTLGVQLHPWGRDREVAPTAE